ncbi:MAG: Omp28-related outer membrane protein [Bacteroidales bacterium]|nr:Omp28-related outer membrane protein [Bacteroidales bacterium]
MKTRFLLYTAIIVLGILQSCDEIEEPYTKDDAFIWNGRKSVIFDITGHTCGNCPRAHETINELVKKYGDAVVPIAIHGTYYAVPVETEDTTTPFHYDFRTDIGDFLTGRGVSTGYYGELYLPTGMVNSYAIEDLTGQNSWETKIAEYISLYPEFLIEIEGENNIADSSLNCSIKITTNNESSRKLSLTVFVVEDHILQWQKDYAATPQDIKGYEHNHILRAGFNGPFGETIKDNNNLTSVGETINKSYSIKQNKSWIISNCLIVAFVYDNDTEEILQAEVFPFQK